VLVRKETVPDDIHGMEVAKGILTSRGGMTSHAAVVARGMGTPCVAGAESIQVNERTKLLTVQSVSVVLKEGDWISIDGTTARCLPARRIRLNPIRRQVHWRSSWAGRTSSAASSACAPTRTSHATRRSPGSSGGGNRSLPHGAHVFGPGRIEHMQAMILAEDEKTRKKGLAKLLPLQRKDFAGLFQAMDGFPV